MNTPNADTLSIRRLTVRSRQSLVGRQLGERLSHGDWPDVAGERWVFIKRIALRGGSGQLPQQLLEEIKRYAATNPVFDQVVVFNSQAELLAALLWDLRLGFSGLRWYWRHWADLFQCPTSTAVYRLLAEHWHLLPSITARLAQQQCLQDVWLCLTQADCRQLAAEIAANLGFRLPDWSGHKLADFIRNDRFPPAGPSVQRVWHAETGARLHSQWQPVLQNLDMQDSRYHLALLLIAWEAAPLRLLENPAACLAALSRQFSGQALQPSAGLSAASSGLNTRLDDHGTSLADKPGLLSSSNASIDSFSTSNQFGPESKATPAEIGLERQAAGINSTRSAAIDQFRGNEHQDAAVLRAVPLIQPKAIVIDPRVGIEDAFDCFETEQGGLLYLLNMLNRPELRRMMIEHADSLASGWAWLYRLGQELQLDQTDPIVDFIALQLGFQSRAGLLELPLLPAREAILELAARWYGKTGVWKPELLTLPGQFRYSPSHIDFYAAMASIRLPVRLAGLDIDPGWLPWLGKVVRFHYE